jgi:hypothetical protein
MPEPEEEDLPSQEELPHIEPAPAKSRPSVSQEEELERIEELETQVGELTSLIEVLLANPVGQQKSEEKYDEAPEASVYRPSLFDRLRINMRKMLGVNEGESIESRLGSVWLSRGAVVLFMTVLVLGIRDDNMEPLAKILTGYVIAAVTIGYGLYKFRATDAFSQAVFGAGLATAYFTTYAAILLPNTLLFESLEYGTTILFATLVISGILAYIRRSETAASISLFLIYYTVILSLSEGGDTEQLAYALVTTIFVAFLAIIFHVRFQWAVFSWTAFVAIYGTYIFFFRWKVPVWEGSEQVFNQYLVALLSILFVAFSIACISGGRRDKPFHPSILPLALFNGILYFVLVSPSTNILWPEYEWVFHFGLAGVCLMFVLMSLGIGTHSNPLIQLYSAFTAALIPLGLEELFPTRPELLIPLLGIEGVLLAFCYRASRFVLFKVGGITLLMLILVKSVLTVNNQNVLQIGDWTVGSNWVACVLGAVTLCVIAWFYEHFAWKLAPEQRKSAGQWFLADSWFDISSGVFAILHASVAAIIMLALTILTQGENPALPFILALVGVAFALTGLFLLTPQVEMACVMLLMGSHIVFHFFLFSNPDSFPNQPQFTEYTFGVVLITYVGSILWERFLSRVEGGTQLEHDLVASIPYIAGSMMLITLAERMLIGIQTAFAHSALAALLMGCAVATRMNGFLIASIAAFALANSSFYLTVWSLEAMDSLWWLVGILLCHVLGERCCAVIAKPTRFYGATLSLLRTLLIVGMVAAGIWGLSNIVPVSQISLYWLGLGISTLILGVGFREKRYRYLALLIIFSIFLRLYLYDLSNLPQFLKLSITAAVTITAIAIAWGYSQMKTRTKEVPDSHEDSEAPG